jgi:hypothetical protein
VSELVLILCIELLPPDRGEPVGKDPFSDESAS